MAKNFLTVSTLITNLFIIAGVTRHWNNMSQQSSTGFGVANPVQYSPEKKETKEFQSLEEALTGEVKHKEPEGDPSY